MTNLRWLFNAAIIGTGIGVICIGGSMASGLGEGITLGAGGALTLVVEVIYWGVVLTVYGLYFVWPWNRRSYGQYN